MKFNRNGIGVWSSRYTPVFAASGALGFSSIFNDSAGHSSFHVGIIRDMALGLEGKHHTITTGWRRGPSHWTKEMMRDRKCLMTGWCGKPPQRFKICRTPKWTPLFVQTHRSCCSEHNWMFFHVPYCCTMFLSVAGSDSKCALWQNYTQAFPTLFSDGVTGHRPGRGLFVSADHAVPLPLIVMQIIKHVVESNVWNPGPRAIF